MGNTQQTTPTPKQTPNYFETFYRQHTFCLCILCNSLNKEFNTDMYILETIADENVSELNQSDVINYNIRMRCSKGHLINCYVTCSTNTDTKYWTLDKCINHIKCNSSYYKTSVPSAPPIIEAEAILDDK